MAKMPTSPRVNRERPVSAEKQVFEPGRARKMEQERYWADASEDGNNPFVIPEAKVDFPTSPESDRAIFSAPVNGPYGRSLANLAGLDRPENPGQVYSYGGRDYPSPAAAKRANPDMPQVSNPPSAEQDYQSQRDRAFFESIGSGMLGLGPMSYVMGGAPEMIEASTNFDEALGGLAMGAGMRAPISPKLPRPAALAPLREVQQWPGNNGFLYSIRGELPAGYGIDRYGDEGKLGSRESGIFTAPLHTPYEQRAVGHRREDRPYHAYETVVPLSVEAGPAVSWFGQPGGGWQFLHSDNMTTLLKDKKIKRKN